MVIHQSISRSGNTHREAVRTSTLLAGKHDNWVTAMTDQLRDTPVQFG